MSAQVQAFGLLCLVMTTTGLLVRNRVESRERTAIIVEREFDGGAD